LCDEKSRTPWELGFKVALSVIAARNGLLFVEAFQQNFRVLGLLDSGSEINLVGEQLLPQLSYSITDALSPNIRGVNGVASKVIHWVRLTVELENGIQYIGVYVVLRELGSAMIFGLPLLRGTKSLVDFDKNVLYMGTKGCVALHSANISPRAPSTVSTAVTAGDLEQDPFDRNGDDMDPLGSTGNPARQSPEDVAATASSSDFLSEHERSVVKQFLMDSSKLWIDDRRGVTNVLQFDMALTDDRPIACRPRRFSLKEQEIIDKEVDSMLDSGVVEHSQSPYASEVVLVKKKTGDWRVCIDFRQINAKTVPDKFPLPRMHDLLRTVRGATHFVSLDLRAGYWQIPVRQSARKYTAFRTSRGLLEFLVMPFGLTNAPAVFQRLMATILGDLYWQGVIVYLDDILVFGMSFEQCMSRLRVVFERLAAANLTLRLDKCDFFPTKIKYLGYWIEKGRLYPDVKRVAALDRLEMPRCVLR